MQIVIQQKKDGKWEDIEWYDDQLQAIKDAKRMRVRYSPTVYRVVKVVG